MGAHTAHEDSATQRALRGAIAQPAASALPSAVIDMSGSGIPPAQAIFQSQAMLGGGSCVPRPRLFAADAAVINSLTLGVFNVHDYKDPLDTVVYAWATNADGSEVWEGVFTSVATDREMGLLTVADLDPDGFVNGTDLSVIGDPGDPFVLATAAGGFFHFGAWVLLTLD